MSSEVLVSELIHKGECWIWIQRPRGPILTGGTTLLLDFLFSRTKTSDANISIITNFVFMKKTRFLQKLSPFSVKS